MEEEIGAWGKLGTQFKHIEAEVGACETSQRCPKASGNASPELRREVSAGDGECESHQQRNRI